MDLVVNGDLRQVAASTVQQLMEEYKLVDKLVVVEVNGTIIDRKDWAATELDEGMKIELVHFVGGG